MKSSIKISRGQIANVFKEYETITALLADQANQSSNRIYKVIDASLDTNITFPSGETRLHAFYKYNGNGDGTIDNYTLISAPYANQSANFQLETANTPDIELSGDGTTATPLEAELTQSVKDDIQKGVTAHGYGLDDVVQNGNETEEEIEVGGLSIRRTDISTKRFSKPLTTIGAGKYIVIKTDRKITDPNNPLVIEMNGGGYKEESGVYVKISFRTSLNTVILDPQVPKILTNNTDLTEAYIIEVDGYLCVAFNRIQGSVLGSYVPGFHYFESIGCNIISVTASDDLDNILSTLGINYLATHDWSNNRFLRYDTATQNLTPTEQENARVNLGIEKPKTIIKNSNFLIDNSLSGALVIHDDNIITINKSGLDGMNDGYQVWLRNDSNSDATLAIVNTGDFTFRINDGNDKTSSENVTIPKGTIYRIDKKDNNKILIYIFPISNSGGGLELGWNAGQAAEGNQVVRLSTNQTISGVKTFESIPVLPNSNPTSNNQSARKKYVDDQVGSRELLSNKVQDIMSNISPDLYPSTQAVAQYILNEFDTEISNYFSTKYRTSDFTLTEDYRLNTIIAGNIEIEIDPNEEVHTSFKCDIISDHSSGTAISLKPKSGWTYRVNGMDDLSSLTFTIPAGVRISIYKKTDNQKFIIVMNENIQL